jgi:hypothetical protein
LWWLGLEQFEWMPVLFKANFQGENIMGDECCNAPSSCDSTKSENVVQLKSEYVGSMETKLAELGAKIDDIGSKAHDAKDAAAVKYEELKKRREEAMVKFHEVKEATGEAFHEFRGGCDKAFDALTHAWEELRSGSEKAAAKLAETKS